MPSTPPDDLRLLIRCPSCSQRFKVGEDLMGRNVECGGCDHRFRINEDVIVRGKKFYPGERKDTILNRFQRVPLAVASSTAALPEMRYLDAPDRVYFEPSSPLRVVAGVIGVAGMVLVSLLLMFGANQAGALEGMTTDKRLMMAGFTGFLGIVLLIFANPRARFKAAGYGFLMSAGLVALPFFFTAGSVPLSKDSAEIMDSLQPVEIKAPEQEKLSDEQLMIGTQPLEDEIKRLAGQGGGKHALGLWLRNLREQNRFLVRDYILRTTSADPQSHYFPRGNGDFLMVVTGINQSLDQLAKIAKELGSVEKMYDELGVVEVRVDNERFVEGPIEKLNDKEDPAFYELNKRDLESIDLMRVSKAVKRLAEAEPKIYRTDISRKLVALLMEDWVDFKGDVCRALSHWAVEPQEAGQAALVQAKKLLERKLPVPQDMIALIVKGKISGVAPILDELWEKKPAQWEELYGQVGPEAEATLLRRFPTSEGMHRQSIVQILAKVGGADSLPLLEAAKVGADAELTVLLGKSIDSIRKRLGP